MENDQTLKQKKIALAQSEHAPIIVEIIKDILKQTPLIGNNDFETIVNAVRFDTQSDIIRGVVDYIAEIRKGILHE